MEKSPKQVYDLFRKSMLSKTNDWEKLISENVELIGPLSQTKGKDKFIEINTPFFESIINSKLHELVETENRIITRISTKVKLPNNKSLTLEVSEWYKIENNLIDSLEVYFDASDFKRELGI